MNLPTILISIFLIAIFVLAIRYLVKKGTCAGCGENGACHSDCSESCEHYNSHHQAGSGKERL